MTIKVLIAVVVLLGLGVGVYLLAGRQGRSAAEVVAARNEPAAGALQQGIAPSDTHLASVAAPVFAGDLAGRTVLDVRTKMEYDQGHLPGAKRLDMYAPDFRTQLEALPRDAPYAIYCQTGSRSRQTLSMMRSLGFTNVIDLQGGLMAWRESDGEVCTSC